MEQNKNEEMPYEILSNEHDSCDLKFKVLLIGNTKVGKSCLTMKLNKNNFEEVYNPTIGFEFYSFSIKTKEKAIKLQIWDTCGQEIYQSIITSFFPNSSLAFIVFSIDK